MTLIFAPIESEKQKIDDVLEISCPGISDEGKKAFHSLYGQFSDLELQDWIIRSCFMKDGKFSDDCVIMKYGDFWPEGGFKGTTAEYAAQKMFGLLARTAMLDRITLSCVTLILGRARQESSLLNFANKYCLCLEQLQIRDILKIKGELLKKRQIRYTCEIEDFDKLKTYRDKHVAHRDLDYDSQKHRRLYRTVEECIERILKAMRVVYPDTQFTIDWKKRDDIIDSWRAPTQWTTNSGEPFILQNLKERTIRNFYDSLMRIEHAGSNSEWAQSKKEEIIAKINEVRAS